MSTTRVRVGSTARPRQQQQQQRTDSDSANDAEDGDLVSLVELLQTYPGLLGNEVEAVARALAQATVAASKVASLGTRGSAMAAAERIRVGQSMAQAAARVANSHIREQTAAEGTDRGNVCGGGSGRDSEDIGGQGSGGRRRWFTQAHVRRLQSEGMVFKKGKFTDEENAAIDEAVASFSEAHGVSGEEMYRHLFQRKENNEAGKRMRRAFWPALAEALPSRQMQAIYHHVRRKIHPHNYQGAWTAGEDGRLRALVAAHGPSWEAISQQLGRMGSNCRDRWRYIHGTPRGAHSGTGGSEMASAGVSDAANAGSTAAGASDVADDGTEAAGGAISTISAGPT
ncbi:RNA polymerase I enhancer binding protein [Coemansia guatemalensis]|uniref:RNA polymerase I enhancer binding protein n=1 Tax=Coemansia guatemalensis TaxID=2761395 RepID=A0A9W8HZX8_9FUNG|nr:RNA polymerase I enhancer binding protein [Coemansia guatemalensis]